MLITIIIILLLYSRLSSRYFDKIYCGLISSNIRSGTDRETYCFGLELQLEGAEFEADTLTYEVDPGSPP